MLDPMLSPSVPPSPASESLHQEMERLRQAVTHLQGELSDRDATIQRLQRENQQFQQRFTDHSDALRESNDTLIAEIVERRRAEEQLQTVLDAVPGIVSWISSDLRYLGVNRHLAQTFNLPPESFIDQDIGFLHTSQEFNQFVREFFASSRSDAYQEISAAVGGVRRRFLIVAQKYNDGKAAFTVGIDITERERAEAALRQAEAKYRNIFENIVEGIFQTTPDGRYLSANPALARIYGYDRPEELVAHLTSIQQQLYVHPERRAEFIQALQRYGKVQSFESQIYRKDGSIIWISENARAVYDAEGCLAYYEGTVEDISDRKQAEAALQQAKAELELRVDQRTAALTEANQRLRSVIQERQNAEDALRASEAELRALFSAMTDVITVFDAAGRYLDIVSTNSELLYNPGTERIGKTVYEVLPPYQATLFMRHIQQALNTGQPVKLEYSLPVGRWFRSEDSPNGRSAPDDFHNTAWYAATVSPLPDNRVIWVARDITEKRRSEVSLQTEQEKSERLLLNILPAAIAAELKQNPESKAYRCNAATILFADIVNFTGYSAGIPPDTMVDLLNQIFSEFDQLAEHHGLEKIKTIGDAYMVVGGLPDPMANHVSAIADMALDMQRVIQQYHRPDSQPFSLRIGIDTGPVVAGVIGKKKFSYDLWGDAVNIASRMESQGQDGRIQVTQAVYEQLLPHYRLRPRGTLLVKGRGKLPTYWLEDRN
ncbi:hypothetical protein C7271_08860 [filamentous cyanobacterium CCP5]|nr:hypothetical protein C7271_08860 [filamentous cyanobacterium CCP5]